MFTSKQHIIPLKERPRPLQVKDFFETMPLRFVPENAKGVNIRVAHEITGTGGGTWTVHIQGGKCHIQEELISEADAHVTMTAETYLAIALGKKDSRLEFMLGKIKVRGDKKALASFKHYFTQDKLPECESNPEELPITDLPFSFDKTFLQCLNQWVILNERHLPKPFNDIAKTYKGNYAVGFVYLDPMAGLTLHLETFCRFLSDGALRKTFSLMDEGTRVVIRLQVPESKPVAQILPALLREQIDLPEVPDWLTCYEKDSQAVDVLARKGSFCNHCGDSRTALQYLQPAYEIAPHESQVVFELAFAYNALSLYAQAISVLQAAIQHDSQNFQLYRELGYAHLNLQQYEYAQKVYMFALKCCPANLKVEQSEIAANLGQAYRLNGEQEKGSKWLQQAWEWAPEGTHIYEQLKQMWSCTR